MSNWSTEEAVVFWCFPSLSCKCSLSHSQWLPNIPGDRQGSTGVRMDIWNENCVSVSTISGSHADTVDTCEECGDVCIDQSEDENYQSRNVGLALSIWIFRYLATPTIYRRRAVEVPWSLG